MSRVNNYVALADCGGEPIDDNGTCSDDLPAPWKRVDHGVVGDGKSFEGRVWLRATNWTSPDEIAEEIRVHQWDDPDHVTLLAKEQDYESWEIIEWREAVPAGRRNRFGVAPEMPADAFMRLLRRYRGVEDPCLRCQGLGIATYSSGATWRGGMGTTKSERDVCDSCWGTGDRYRTGVDLRRLRDEEQQRVALAAVTELAESAGATMPVVAGAVSHIIRALDVIIDKRGAPAAPYLPEMAKALGNTLRRAMGVKERT